MMTTSQAWSPHSVLHPIPLAILDLRLVDRLDQVVAARLGESRFDLTRDAFELRVRHGQANLGTTKIGKRLNLRRISLRDQNRTLVGGVDRRRSDEIALI